MLMMMRNMHTWVLLHAGSIYELWFRRHCPCHRLVAYGVLQHAGLAICRVHLHPLQQSLILTCNKGILEHGLGTEQFHSLLVHHVMRVRPKERASLQLRVIRNMSLHVMGRRNAAVAAAIVIVGHVLQRVWLHQFLKKDNLVRARHYKDVGTFSQGRGVEKVTVRP